jgi:hypothetical protein
LLRPPPRWISIIKLTSSGGFDPVETSWYAISSPSLFVILTDKACQKKKDGVEPGRVPRHFVR